MPGKTEHLAQALHNSEFSTAFDNVRFSDWAATAIFYAGLQYVDAFLATQSIKPGSHDMRDRYISMTRELKPIAPHYWKLKNSSRNARYYPPTKFSPTEIKELREVHLAEIVKAISASGSI